MTYDSSTGLNFNPTPQKSDDTAIPEFFVKPVQNNFKSEAEGRAIFDNIEYVRIIIPGDKHSIAEERVKDDHRRRWPNHYNAFKQGLTIEEAGTPLEAWPLLSNNPALIAEFKAVNVKTVEALGGITDGNLHTIGLGGRVWRDKAKAWLQSAADGAPLAAAEQRIKELTAEKDVQAQQIADLSAAVARLQEQAHAGA